MSDEREIEVGSYVCARDGDGPHGLVVQIESDERGPGYDLLHVRLYPYAPGADPLKCQRTAMMRPYPRPVPSRYAYADTPQGSSDYAGALLICCAERDEALKASTSEQEQADSLSLMGTRLNIAQHMISGLQTRLEEALREAARHERRAASWQGAAQDALAQLEKMIERAEGVK